MGAPPHSIICFPGLLFTKGQCHVTRPNCLVVTPAVSNKAARELVGFIKNVALLVNEGNTKGLLSNGGKNAGCIFK